jgi:hypothetical protein
MAALALGACSTVGQLQVARTAIVHEVSDEVACMSECLDDGSESCDSCAADCLKDPDSARVAAGE